MTRVSDLGDIVVVGSHAIGVPHGTSERLVRMHADPLNTKPDDLAYINPNLIGRMIANGVRPCNFTNQNYARIARDIFERGIIVDDKRYDPIL